MCLLAFVQRPSTVTVGTAVPCWLQPETTDPSTHNHTHTNTHAHARVTEIHAPCRPILPACQARTHARKVPGTHQTRTQRAHSSSATDPIRPRQGTLLFLFLFSFLFRLRYSNLALAVFLADGRSLALSRGCCLSCLCALPLVRTFARALLLSHGRSLARSRSLPHTHLHTGTHIFTAPDCRLDYYGYNRTRPSCTLTLARYCKTHGRNEPVPCLLPMQTYCLQHAKRTGGGTICTRNGRVFFAVISTSQSLCVSSSKILR